MAYIANPADYTAASGLAAFAVLASATVNNGANALFTIESGSAGIAIDAAGVVTLPQGYQWSVVVQLGVNQAGNRFFDVLVDGVVVATNQRVYVPSSTSNSANLWAANVLKTDTASATVQVRNNSGAAVAVDGPSSGLLILGVTL